MKLRTRLASASHRQTPEALRRRRPCGAPTKRSKPSYSAQNDPDPAEILARRTLGSAHGYAVARTVDLPARLFREGEPHWTGGFQLGELCATGAGSPFSASAGA